MTYLTGEVTVIHNESQLDFSAFTYSAVYCNVGATYIINGASVVMVGGETLEVVVDGDTTTPSGSAILFLGNPNAVQALYKTGKMTGNTITEAYQFVNIQNGNPTISAIKL